MSAKNFYDAVLVGAELPNLLAAALLAKRGFRVLVIGQGTPPPSYTLSDLQLPRAPFALTGAHSPALARTFSELALRPLIQRRTRRLEPAFQAILPRHRLDLGADARASLRELARELPDAQRSYEQLVESTARADQKLDGLLARDLIWPPESFFERRAFTRALRDARLAESVEPPLDLSELGSEHPLRQIIAACLRFADGSSAACALDARALRLWSARCNAGELLEGGLSGLHELLLESIRTHNGKVQLESRVCSFSRRRGAVESIELSPSDEEIGCHFVLWGGNVNTLRPLLRDPGELAPMFVASGEPRPRYARYTLNLVLRAEGVPEGLARDALLLSGEPLWLEMQWSGDRKRAIWTTQRLLPLGESGELLSPLAEQRESILTQLQLLAPFLHQHLELVDSPHDGRPPEDLGRGSLLTGHDGHRRGPMLMETVYTYAQPRLHGMGALSVRTPIARLLLCNGQVLPGLSLEGRFVTAWSAAQVVTKALKRGWMNRGRWTKVQL